MARKTNIGGLFVRLIIVFLAAGANFGVRAQSGGPCLLGVGNCPPGTTATTQSTGSTGSKASKLYEGAEARAIAASLKYGARYVIILSRDWDYDCKCYVEERAWVSSITGDQGDRIVVEYGSRVRVAVNANTWTASQVNQAEIYNQQARTNISAWQKYQAESVAPYLNNPTYKAWAQGEYQRAGQWIAYYNQIIANNNKVIAVSAP